MNDIDSLINGSIDIHIHAGPDILPDRVNAVEAARQAYDAGMKAIVLKNHFYDTAPLALLAGRFVPEIKVFGGICLNYETGGLNYHAVESSCKLGARVIWMPTLSAINSRRKMSKMFGMSLEGQGFSILDKKNNLVVEMETILSIIKKYDTVLATGHLSPEEIFKLIDRAKKAGIIRLLVTHANSFNIVDRSLSMEQQKIIAEKNVFIEYSGVNLLPSSFGNDPSPMVEAIKTIGANRFILSTDMGPATNPPPVEGLRIFISTLLERGISSEEIRIMVKENPEKLLGI